MTYADNYNIRTTSVKFNDVADALDGLITRAYGGTTSGGPTAYTASPTPAWDSYVASSFIIIIPNATNTAGSPSVTLNVSGLGAKAIKRSGSDIIAGTLVSGVPTLLAYTGVHFEIFVVENALAKDGSNSMTGNLNFGGFIPTNVGAGTVSAPAYCANNDSNTGIFAPAADTWAVATNGTERFRIDSTGNVGVGTTSPGYALDVIGGARLRDVITDATNKAGRILGTPYTNANGDFLAVDVKGLSGQNQIVIGGGNASYKAATEIAFYTAANTTTATGTERVRISSSGNLGIGETSPAENLHIKSATPRIRFEDTDGASATIYANISGNYGAAGSIAIQADPGNAGAGSLIDFQVDGTVQATVNQYGLGVGTTASSGSGAILEVSGRASIAHSTNSSSIAALATSGSYTSLGISSRCDRAASSAYDLFTAYSNYTSASDLEFRVTGDGNGKCDGAFTGGGADYAEFFEWADGNLSSEDRRGKTVSLVGHKIKIAEAGDLVIGVVSANPSVVGDSAWNKWTGKYLRDDFNSYILEDYEVWEWSDSETGKQYSYAFDAVPEGIVVPNNKTILVQQRRKLNPDYDSSLEYIPRESRKEWAPIGLMGKLRVIKGQIKPLTWIKLRDISDTVEEWLVK